MCNFSKDSKFSFFDSVAGGGRDVSRGQELFWQGAGKTHQTANTCFLRLAPSKSHTKAISLAFDPQLSDGHSLLEQAMLSPLQEGRLLLRSRSCSLAPPVPEDKV